MRKYKDLLAEGILLLKFHLLNFLVKGTVSFKKNTSEKRIVIIRNDHLGDFIISLSCFEKIHRKFSPQGYKITVIVDRPLQKLAEKCPYFNEVESFDMKKMGASFFYRVRTYRRFRRIRAEQIINFLVFGRCAINDYFIYFSSAEKKYGILLDSWPLTKTAQMYLKRGNRFYTDMMQLNPEHTLLENEHFFINRICNENFLPEPGSLNFLTQQLPSTEIGAPYYLVVPGSSDPRQRWNAEKFAALIDQLKEAYPGYIPVISGTRQEEDIARTIISSLKRQNSIINFCGKKNLFELLSNIRETSFIITNDTGPLHAAAAYQIPAFCILGGGHFGAYNPCPVYRTVNYICHREKCFSCNWICSRMENKNIFPCISSIKVEDVFREINSYLTHGRKNSQSGGDIGSIPAPENGKQEY